MYGIDCLEVGQDAEDGIVAGRREGIGTCGLLVLYPHTVYNEGHDRLLKIKAVMSN